MAVLAGSNAASRIPAQDLGRARSFYAGKLGLEPVEERPGGLRYRCGNGEFALFESAGAADGDHTQMAWEVEDLEETIAELRERGVIFGEYDVPGLETVNGIAEVEGNYPSKGGVGEKAAWFKRQRGQPTCHRSSRDLKYPGACNQPGAFCRATPKTQAETVIRQIPRICAAQFTSARVH
jgi:catechol 2,3-dioxygenase-like lactoylglutathione lyase family enzyme